MFDALISGLVAGWGVAVPLGAIGVLIVDLGMRTGFRHAAPAAAAVATADLLYAAVAAVAGTAAAHLLEPHEHALKLIAAGVLAAVAVVGLRAARRRAKAAREEGGGASAVGGAPASADARSAERLPSAERLRSAARLPSAERPRRRPPDASSRASSL